MLNMNKHVLKMYKWINGMLTLTKHEFERLEDALKHAEENAAHSFKVFDHTGNLCHSQTHPVVKSNTYA